MPTRKTKPADDANRAAEQTVAAVVANADEGPAKLAAAIMQLPVGAKVATNLDTYERERPQDPFWFQHGGAFFKLTDPADIDVDDMVIIQEQPRLMMHVLMDPEHRGGWAEVKRECPLTVGKLRQLSEAYVAHFGLTSLGELAGSSRR